MPDKTDRRERATPFVDLLPSERNSMLAVVSARALGTVAGLVVLYYTLPFDHLSGVGSVAVVTAGVAGMLVLIAWEVRSILHARYPGVRAVEAVATLVPLFLLLFATLYYLLGRAVPGSFNTSLSRTDSLYFTLTTFSTVGYGDIAATTSGARIAVMFQIVSDLVVIGVGIKALVGAVQLGRRLQSDGGNVPDAGVRDPGP